MGGPGRPQYRDRNAPGRFPAGRENGREFAGAAPPAAWESKRPQRFAGQFPAAWAGNCWRPRRECSLLGREFAGRPALRQVALPAGGGSGRGTAAVHSLRTGRITGSFAKSGPCEPGCMLKNDRAAMAWKRPPWRPEQGGLAPAGGAFLVEQGAAEAPCRGGRSRSAQPCRPPVKHGPQHPSPHGTPPSASIDAQVSRRRGAGCAGGPPTF